MAGMTPEGRVKKNIKSILETLKAEGYPVWYYMPVPGPLSAPGIPDFVCCVNGFFLAIEAKAPGGKTTAIQELVLSRMSEAGAAAIVVTGSGTSALLVLLYNLAGKHRA